MKVITFEDIVSLRIEPLTCYEWASDVIKNKDNFEIPKKISIKPKEGVFYNTMPVYDKKKGYFGLKVVSRFPDRNPSVVGDIMLFDQDGECITLMDGTWITVMRTASVAVHSIKLFAKKNFSSIGIIGLGNVCWATMNLLLNLFREGNSYYSSKIQGTAYSFF